MIEKLKNFLAYLVVSYVMPRDELVTRAYKYYTTANEVALRTDLMRIQAQFNKAEKKLTAFQKAAQQITKQALELDDSEMSPFVHQTVLMFENANRCAS